MPYPNPPWNLHGNGFQTLHLLDVDRVRPAIPAALNILTPLPGKTLGGIYLATYGAGSTLQYHELIVVSGVIYHAGKLGAWISHIYVDLPDSVMGGREIWGLPKELAAFEWDVTETTAKVKVKQGDRTLCSLQTQPQPYTNFLGWRQPLWVAVFGQKPTELLWFTGQTTVNWKLTNATLQIPTESPFSQLQLGSPWLSFRLNDLTLIANPPKQIS
ncbi:MAG: acetoacetate decarboxylase family protein [Oculatellaceae cyanobacterium Prado106]|jgi:hypothetical protein|nr:acetoacetate decarboxylase family protein [Oculatellaceae cyanobacterium Prado106]